MGSVEAAAMTFSHPAIFVPTVKQERKAILIGLEVIQIFGYVPGIGVIAGIARMILAATKFNEFKEFKAFQMLRGAAEIVGLGPIMLITDFIATGILLHLMKNDRPKKRTPEQQDHDLRRNMHSGEEDFVRKTARENEAREVQIVEDDIIVLG